MKKFERPMFRHNGFLYPVPDYINVRWVGNGGSAKGNMYTADTMNYP